MDSFNFSSYDSDLVKSTFSRREGVEKLLIKECIDPLSEEAELLRLEARNNKKLLMKYVPDMYDGRVVLLKADYFDDEDAEYSLNISNGWKTIIKPGIEVYRIPARHEEFFDQDNLSLISERLKSVLNKNVKVIS